MPKRPLSIENISPVRAALHRAVESVAKHGMRFVSYGGIIQTLDGAKEVMANNYPEGWIDHYMKSGYKQCDPCLAHAMTSSLQVTWSQNLFSKNIVARKLYDDVVQAGMLAGATIPVRDHRGNLASINFAGDNKEPNSFWSEERIGHLYFVAFNLHTEIAQSYLNTIRFENDIKLSSREHEILRFAAAGKTNWEISMILKVAESTIEYHMKNIRDKLEAVNTPHAIFKAAQLNLIDLSR